MAGFRRSLRTIETFGFSLSITAPTLAMAFAATLTARSAGWAAPLAYLIGSTIVTTVALSFVAFGRRLAHAGSVYASVMRSDFMPPGLTGGSGQKSDFSSDLPL
jgi:amino acid transporter